MSLGSSQDCFRGACSLWGDVVQGGAVQGDVAEGDFFLEAQLGLSLVKISLQGNTPPCYIFEQIKLYGVVQSVLVEAGVVCKGLEDVVGSVRGFLKAQA